MRQRSRSSFGMSRREGGGRREEKQGELCREAVEKREIRADNEGKLWER